jgi:hypothetical protein
MSSAGGWQDNTRSSCVELDSFLMGTKPSLTWRTDEPHFELTKDIFNLKARTLVRAFCFSDDQELLLMGHGRIPLKVFRNLVA